MKKMRILKTLYIVLLIFVLVIIAGLAGKTDFDEYIEVNSSPKVRIIE